MGIQWDKIVHGVALWGIVSGGLVGTLTAAESESAGDKVAAVAGTADKSAGKAALFTSPTAPPPGARSTVSNGAVQLPLVVVQGSPYEMGYQLGAATRDEIHEFAPRALAGVQAELGITEDQLRDVWARTAAYADDRVEQELAGLADGAGISLGTLQALHAAPLLMPYSCSSIAAWGEATEDGHLYQTRNLDWSLELGAHNFPVITVYVPDRGVPHVVPSFAGVIGAHTGMNARGIVLSEMGDASSQEMPYFVHAPHFTLFFRSMLYDADSLERTLQIFQAQPLTKRYHFVFGDGQTDKRAVKLRVDARQGSDQRVAIWNDNDPQDEFAPHVLSCVVYNDEGRGAFPTLQRDFGKLNGEKLVALANQIPIKGGNVVNVVYDATALKMWVSYAHGDQEAYQRPSVLVDLSALKLANGERAFAQRSQ